MNEMRDAIAAELLQFATADLKPPPFDEDCELPIPYKETASGLLYFKEAHVGTETVPLTNFIARIVRDVEEDDGEDLKRVLTIRATVGETVHCFEITAQQFQGMQWVIPRLGTSAVIFPGRESHARTAIQMLSKDVEYRKVITHTGWRSVEDEWVYLHAAGAIGAEGVNPNISVCLHSDLSKFVLPEPPRGMELREAITASLGLLPIGPARLTYSLLASVYRAPLGNVDFSDWIAGGSGAGKSVAAALAQAHYGAGFDYRSAPGNWSSTDNALETVAFYAKDVLLMIDDYAPTDKQSRDRLNRKADRILRAQANKSGRQRQNADGSLRSTKPPRGLIVSTGEDVPPGRSLRGRMMICQLNKEGPNSLNWVEVLGAQKDAAGGKYASSMAGYVQWLAKDYSQIKKELPGQITTLRHLALKSRAHARTPENVANLGIGLAYFLQYALESDAITQGEAVDILHEGWRAIGQLAAEQVQYQEASDPVRIFIEFLSSALATGRAYVATREDGSVPPDASAWGWGGQGSEWQGQGQKVGWIDGDDLYLDPNASRAVVQDMANRTDQQLVISPTQLYQQLDSQGYLLSTDRRSKRQTYPVRRVCEGKSHSVLHLSAHIFRQEDEAEKPDKPDNLAINTEIEELSDAGYLESLVIRPDSKAVEPDTDQTATVGFAAEMSGGRNELDIQKPNNININGSNVGNVGKYEGAHQPEAEKQREGNTSASEGADRQAGTVAGVAFIITRALKQQLADLGYTASQINQMTPDQAHRIIEVQQRAIQAKQPKSERAKCDSCGSAVTLIDGAGQCKSCGIILRYEEVKK